MQLLRGKIEVQVTEELIPKELESMRSVPTYGGGFPSWCSVDTESATNKVLSSTYTDSDCVILDRN